MDFSNILSEFNENYKAKLILDEVSFFKMENELEINFLSRDMIDESLLDIFFNEKLSGYGISLNFNITYLDSILQYFNDIYPNLECETNEDICTVLFNDENEKDYYINNNTFKSFMNKMEKLQYTINLEKNEKLDDIDFEEIQKQKEQELIDEIKKAEELSKRNESKNSKNAISEETESFQFGFIKSAPKTFTDIEDLEEDTDKIALKGHIYELSYFVIKNGAFVSFDLDNGSNAVSCKVYVKNEKLDYFKDNFKEGMGVIVSGVYKYDDYAKTNLISVSSIEEIILPEKVDLEDNKRIEFNIHSKYTQLESVVDINSLFKRLKSFGHTAVGITDLFNVQSYPEIYRAAKKNNIKLNLGLQTNIYEDYPSLLTNYKNEDITKKDFVVFDIETTGLSNFTDKIIEIGAVRIRNGEIIDKYQRFVNPKEPLSDFTTELTGITNDMVINEKEIDEVLPDFLEFCGDSVLVAQNAEFDLGFIIQKSNEFGIDFKPVYVDTLYISRAINPEFTNHKLGTLAAKYKVSLQNHHRAIDDAYATGEIFIKMLEQIKELGYEFDNDINKIKTSMPISHNMNFQNIMYAKDKIGLKNLYIIVSKSNLEYYNREAGIPLNILKEHREGLLLGTGNYKSKLFKLVSLKYNDEVLLNELSNFDFVTIVPKDFSTHLINRGYIKDENHLEEINKKLVELAKKQDKLFIAIGDVYYLDSKDYPYRNILKNYPRKRGLENSGAFYLKNTREMLDNFDYLNIEDREDAVIYNTYKLNDLIENISPIADGTFPPRIKDAEKTLTEEAHQVAKNIYGENLPDIVKERLDRELNSIISNGYAALYIIARMLVRKSNEDGYLVGSRGSVGSSFAATMAEITEVNPLPPHYICEKCHHSEFVTDGKYTTGVDLPIKNCPNCGVEMKRDGFDIPFETFLGFSGNKEPDIDLNFASVYQSKIHRYTETLFGKNKVFKAGTLGTIQDNIAYGMARKFKEFYPNDTTIKTDSASMNRVKRMIVGVKRSSGQHPGGLIIVPEDKDIEDFTPVQYPADDASTGIITTHFDYHAIDTNLLKLDLLGHNVPTMIRLLTDMSGVDAAKIDLSDKETMDIFSSTKSLKPKHDYSNKNNGSLGIPEFGTSFVRGMLDDTKPTTFEELIRISGLSHGTDVWLGNAQELVRNGITDLKGAICTRDDIMNYLIAKGLDSKLSFDIMEQVRKGKGLKEDQITEMKNHNVPDWYIDSCLKIKYMFPKAHAVAYVMMSYRLAYFKVHMPEYFYAVVFTNSVSDFKYEHISKGLNYLTLLLDTIKNDKENNEDISKVYLYELAEEMYARDIKFADIDLYESDPLNFVVVDKGLIRPPLTALPTVSESMALKIAEARKEGEFISKEDFAKRAKIGKKTLEYLEGTKILDKLQDTNQIDFFSL